MSRIPTRHTPVTRELAAQTSKENIRTFLEVLSATATQQAIADAVAALVNSSPAALDQLNEFAAALGNDPNFATTMLNALAGKQPSSTNLTTLAAAAAITSFCANLLSQTNAETFRSAIGAGTSSFSGAWNDISSKPTTLGGFGITDALTAAAAAATYAVLAFPTIAPAIGGTPGTQVVAGARDATLAIDANCGASITGNNTSKTVTIDAVGVHQITFAADATAYLTHPFSSVVNATMVAGRLYHIPFRVSKRQTFNEVALNVGVSVPGSSTRVGVRNFNIANGQPSTLIVDAGEVSTGSIGTRSVTGLNFTLNPGIYYFCVISNNTPGLRGSAAGAAMNMLGAMFGSVMTPASFVFRDTTYGALAVDESGNSHTLAGNAPIPAVGIR